MVVLQLSVGCLSIPVFLIESVNILMGFQCVLHHSFPEYLSFFTLYLEIWYCSRCKQFILLFYTSYRFIPCFLFSYAIIQHQLQSLFQICMNMINVHRVVIFHFLPDLLQTWKKNTGLIPVALLQVCHNAPFVVTPTLSFLIIDFLDSFLYLILKEISRILFRVKLYYDCHHHRNKLLEDGNFVLSNVNISIILPTYYFLPNIFENS